MPQQTSTYEACSWVPILQMASVIRVKRRRGEDPAEALLLSSKRLRKSQESQPESAIESVLSFAGTISSKAEPISSHIKEAIKQRKLHKQLHPNALDFTTGKPSVTSRARSQNAQASHNNRYRVLSGKRALDLSELDDKTSYEKDSVPIPILEENSASSPSAQDGESKKESHSLLDNKENSSTCTKTQKDFSEVLENPVLSTQKENFVTGDPNAQNDRQEFCIFDIEKDTERPDPFFGVSQKSASGITINNVPMVCRKAEPELTDDSQFVYDLYYTHSSLADLDLQAALTVEVLCDAAFVNEREDEDGEEGRFVYEDSDDSNDENNWRNDYPDEDPHFFENADYDYAEDMVDTGYLNGDETDLLSYWMGSRCRVESQSDNDEDEYDGESDNLED
ncbi:protein SLC7A6OS [Elysia marginata]|uniref:Probable RNA polymerase II nuclear localization protein SLC7A6OS n=1 Tax=Elysia marginata TaxID=1093978 RepID=A0AAV4IMQ7_9GAST|nr:protein SLC7A6OS [Elysia marginata]